MAILEFLKVSRDIPVRTLMRERYQMKREGSY